MAASTTETRKNFKFKAEISQLLDILTHSLYTHRDVYIRELISNAADALDKVRFLEVKGEPVCNPKLDLEIKIELDKDANTFKITDTGIGMTHDELVKNIGTIAKSGTSEFLKKLDNSKETDINLIGKFGVGFYSVFMAGEKVEVTSKSAQKEEEAFTWTSDGKGSFSIEQAPKNTKRGTSVKVYLREDAKDFAEKFTVQNTIEKYSNFVPFPIMIDGEKVNKISAIWREPKSSVNKDQYNEFYKFIAHQSDDALSWLHFSADVPLQFHSLLYVPKTNLEMMGFGKEEEGIHLFVKRILIDAKAKDILPPYLRFVKGVVESDDLPLNISRETLQENPYMTKIKNTVIGKFLSHLHELAEKEPDNYKTLWAQHGRILKEGYNDYAHKDQIADLFLFNSSKCSDANELISLKTYVDRMNEKQSHIIFLSGPSREVLDVHPTMEIYKAKDIEVLYCFDPIDEFVLPGLFKYADKDIISADQMDVSKLDDIPTKSQKDDTEKEEKADEKEVDNLARRIKDILGKRVESVRISKRLIDSPAILVGSDKGMSSQMEKIMHMMNKETEAAPKVMEINPKHPIILDLLTIYNKDVKDPLLNQAAENLFSSILLLDGQVDNPQTMASALQKLIAETTNLYLDKGKK